VKARAKREAATVNRRISPRPDIDEWLGHTSGLSEIELPPDTLDDDDELVNRGEPRILNNEVEKLGRGESDGMRTRDLPKGNDGMRG
jgi:hypothetical protein